MGRTRANTVVEKEAENSVVNDTTVETNEKTEKHEEEKVEEKKVKVEPLNDSDEIEVISLIPNVSYKDSKTLDMYEWSEVGHSELMTFETLKNMWRTNKGYFKNLWLKPCDERVINKFGLTKTFKDYEYLMDVSNYTEENIEAICEAISNTPNSLKISICDKVKALVADKKLKDVTVIKALEKRFKIDLI